MPKNPEPSKKSPDKSPVKSPAKAVASTPVRNSPVPKSAPVAKAKAPAPKEISYSDIAKRAFEIHCGGTGGSEFDNWLRAEKELKGL